VQEGVARRKLFPISGSPVSTKDKRRKQAAGKKVGKQRIESMIIGKNGCSGENPCATFFPIAVTKGKSLWFPLGGRRLHCSLAQHASATLVRLHHITFPPSKQQPPTEPSQATGRTNCSLPQRASERAQSCQVTMMMMMIQLHNMLLAAKSRAQEAA
jgi:hypothetical protein